MRFREHRGKLAGSITTTVEFHTREELARYLVTKFDWLERSNATISAYPYSGDDDPIGWRDVHIVIAEGHGVLGYMEGPMPPKFP
jgi:hypothetical protein